MSSLKEEDAKWKINIKHEPACALYIKSEMKMKKEPGCPLHTESDVKIKNEPGSGNEKPLKHDPGYTLAHDLSIVKHDPGYTLAHDLSVVHDWTVKVDDDGDGDVDLPEKIIKAEPDVSDGKTDEKCKSKEKETGE